MIRKYLHHALLALVFMLGLISMQSCERINEHKENGLQLATDFCVMQSELASIIEVADEMGDQTTGKGTPSKFVLGVFGKAASVKILDSTFFDGDGIEFEINFGPNKLPLAENQRGFDGKYRAGTMHIKIQSHYIENTAKLELKIDKSDNFWVGANPNQPKNMAISCSTIRQDAKIHSLAIESLDLFGQKTITLEGTVQLLKLTNSKPGVIGNKYQILGKGELKESDDEQNWEIVQPLIKNVVPGCSGEYINGMLELKDSEKSSTTILDYDPFENESCDRIVRVTIAGKITDITLD
ncbi:MAG: hypothetical protein RL411_1847 [Bacteroidota bacterium]|jgi:hypothetical protein